MNIPDKLLLGYTSLRAFYSLIEYILNFIKIVKLQYSVYVQIYYGFTLLIFMYSWFGLKFIKNNFILIILSILQILTGITYLGISIPEYSFVLYDIIINIIIISSFIIYEYCIYNKSYRVNTRIDHPLNKQQIYITNNRLHNSTYEYNEL